MAYIGEITIKIEFPEYYSKEQAGVFNSRRAEDIYRILQRYEEIRSYVQEHPVYDEEDMRKEMEPTPCHGCIHVDASEEEEPCISCLDSDQHYPYYTLLLDAAGQCCGCGQDTLNCKCEEGEE